MQVDSELTSELTDLIREEMDSHYQELSLEQSIEEFKQIQAELEQELGHFLIQSAQHDETYQLANNSEVSQRLVEEMAHIYDPSNNSQYICAICSQYVYKLGSKVICERRGCLDLDLQVKPFHSDGC